MFFVQRAKNFKDLEIISEKELSSYTSFSKKEVPPRKEVPPKKEREFKFCSTLAKKEEPPKDEYVKEKRYSMLLTTILGKSLEYHTPVVLDIPDTSSLHVPKYKVLPKIVKVGSDDAPVEDALKSKVKFQTDSKDKLTEIVPNSKREVQKDSHNNLTDKQPKSKVKIQIDSQGDSTDSNIEILKISNASLPRSKRKLQRGSQESSIDLLDSKIRMNVEDIYLCPSMSDASEVEISNTSILSQSKPSIPPIRSKLAVPSMPSIKLIPSSPTQEPEVLFDGSFAKPKSPSRPSQKLKLPPVSSKNSLLTPNESQTLIPSSTESLNNPELSTVLFIKRKLPAVRSRSKPRPFTPIAFKNTSSLPVTSNKSNNKLSIAPTHSSRKRAAVIKAELEDKSYETWLAEREAAARRANKQNKLMGATGGKTTEEIVNTVLERRKEEARRAGSSGAGIPSDLWKHVRDPTKYQEIQYRGLMLLHNYETQQQERAASAKATTKS